MSDNSFRVNDEGGSIFFMLLCIKVAGLPEGYALVIPLSYEDSEAVTEVLADVSYEWDL